MIFIFFKLHCISVLNCTDVVTVKCLFLLDLSLYVYFEFFSTLYIETEFWLHSVLGECRFRFKCGGFDKQ